MDKHIEMYPMPNIRSKDGPIAERARLAELENEVQSLRNRLTLQRREFDRTVEQGYAEAYDLIQQMRPVPETPKTPEQPKRIHRATVGFERPETWWQWTKRVIFRMS